jgi:hypothetical protein
VGGFEGGTNPSVCGRLKVGLLVVSPEKNSVSAGAGAAKLRERAIADDAAREFLPRVVQKEQALMGESKRFFITCLDKVERIGKISSLEELVKLVW